MSVVVSAISPDMNPEMYEAKPGDQLPDECTQIDAGRAPIGGWGSGLDEPATDRVPGQRDPVVEAELLEHVRPVALDGLLADHECLGDLARRVALGDQLDDLELARCEWILALRPWRTRGSD